MKPRAAILPALALALSACGLKPMYAGGGSGAVAQGLSGIDVSAIEGKGGWLMRIAADEVLEAEGADGLAAFLAAQGENVAGVAVRRS